AMSQGQAPKLEAYDGYLFAVLRGADGEVDFFVGPTFLVTVHCGESTAVAEFADNAQHSPRPLAEGPVGLFHLIVDKLVDAWRPAIGRLGERIAGLDRQLFDKPSPTVVRDVLDLRREIFELGQVTTAQRDIVHRLARREFVD